jgi:hypothetical protein
MAVSQFKIYTSSDPQGPGLMTGLSGSLTNILDYCLVYGYGTSSYYKSPAGWTKPLPNVSSSAGQLPQLACYKNGASGSQFTVFVNDASPNATATGKEAWATGWEYMTSLTGSGLGNIYTASNSAGTGYGQFPLPVQQLTYGHTVWRKSASADTIGRPWLVAADCNTFYIWIASGDLAGGYQHFGFGDFYSLYPNDNFNGFIYGKATENSSGAPPQDWVSSICNGSGYQGSAQLTFVSYNIAQPGHWLTRGVGGSVGGSTGFTKKGDSENNGGYNATPVSVPMYGILQTPNGPDNSYYVQPLYIIEPYSVMLRGRLRGLYHPCHPVSSLSDGQIVVGGGDYAGKSFMVIKTDITGNSVWMLEISNTVETN